MDNQVQPVKPSDEIDLLELFNRMSRSIKNFFSSIFKYSFDVIFFIIQFFYKNVLPIGVFTFLGLATGIIMYYSVDNQYSSEMVASSNSLSTEQMVNYINNLDNLCNKSGYEELSRLLKIDAKSASKIKSFKALWAFDLNRDGIADFIDYTGKYNIKVTDTVQKRIFDRFYIKAVVSDENILSLLKSGIYNYVNSNPYILEQNDIRKRQQREMITDYNQEIRLLDSLQKYEYFKKNTILPQVGASQTILFTEKDKHLYHTEKFSLISQRQAIETRLLVHPDPITVIQDFAPLLKVENTMTKYLIKFGLAGFIFGTIAMFLWLYGKKIHKALLVE